MFENKEAKKLYPLILSGFAAVASAGDRVLVLGTMPGEASLRAGQYYAHPRNAFWPIMGELVGALPALPYEQRVARLSLAGIALWDTLQHCTRPGSLDSAIRDEVANDFPAFFAAHPAITHIFFNGAKAHAAFLRHALPHLPANRLTLTPLPSTSPANARLTLAAKLAAWRAILPV